MRSYGALALDRNGNRWVIEACEPHVAIRLKHIFPRIPKTAVPPYEIENTPDLAADLAWFLQRYPLAVNDNDRADLSARCDLFAANQAEMERILLPNYQPPARAGLRDGQQIRPYQAQAVDLLANCGGMLLGDDVGLGKTFVAGGACLIADALPAIIVVQGHVQSQWLQVLTRFLNLTAAAIAKTRPYSLMPADIFIFRYSQIVGWVDFFRELKPGLVAYDEIQELRRGEDAAKGRAAVQLSALARYRLGLSATPIYNYGQEIWNIMRPVRPEVLGSYGDFWREWCPSGTISDPAALGTYLREQYAFLRRTKRDVGQQMPAVSRVVQPIDAEEDALRSIDDVAHALAIQATSGAFTARGRAVRELDLKVRHATGVAKARSVAAVARILLESGEPIVLVGWHRDVYDIWLEEMKDFTPVLYSGSESSREKDMAKSRFVAGETLLFIMSLRSGAGLDGLQFRCSTIVFGELDWSPGVHHQCIGRLDRDGQPDPVTAIFLVAEDGSDPPMQEVLGLKASQASAIIDPAADGDLPQGDPDRMKKLVQRYLDKRGGRHVVPVKATAQPMALPPPDIFDDPAWDEDMAKRRKENEG